MPNPKDEGYPLSHASADTDRWHWLTHMSTHLVLYLKNYWADLNQIFTQAGGHKGPDHIKRWRLSSFCELRKSTFCVRIGVGADRLTITAQLDTTFGQISQKYVQGCCGWFELVDLIRMWWAIIEWCWLVGCGLLSTPGAATTKLVPATFSQICTIMEQNHIWADSAFAISSNNEQYPAISGTSNISKVRNAISKNLMWLICK